MLTDRQQKSLLLDIAEIIRMKNPMQKKMVDSILADADPLYWQRVENFSAGFGPLLKDHDISTEKVADCYLKLCKDMLLEQIKFRKTGRYSATSFVEVAERVYHSETEMEAMVYGLAISQFLWRNHYALYDFYIDTLSEINSHRYIRRCLEIGPGHGLHLVESLKAFPSAHFDVVDISAISLEICKRVVSYFAPGHVVIYHRQDVREFANKKTYDLVVINEVLEHLEDPLGMMQTIVELTAENGFVFLTTCANAPSIDHIYLYDSVEAIQVQIQQAGLRIINEIILPVQPDIPRQDWQKQKVEINYGAFCAIA